MLQSPLRIARCALAALCACAVAHAPEPAADGRYRRAALAVATWLEANARTTADGTVWPVQPDHPDEVSTNLYSGTAGTLLFFLRAHASTGEARFLARARSGADALVAMLRAAPGEDEVGLYSGMAGIGFVLHRAQLATGEAAYGAAARRCVTALAATARPVGDGVEWNDSDDVIRGAAGIGLFLLYAAEHLADDRALPLAEAAGRRLLATALPTAAGLGWERRRGYPTYQPNFSHGTAGVARFLLELAERTGRAEFRAAALAGAAEVVARAEPATGFLPHHLPGGEQLFYLGWCHGPAGIAALYHRLWLVTGDRAWRERVGQIAAALLASGCPEHRSPGFWNNESLCCGTAGVAAFAFEVHRLTGERCYLDFALRATDVLLARAEHDAGGLCWRHAENRVSPAEVATQTGYMQGAAGIGTWLFDLDDWLRGRHAPIRLPDSPY
ncbi:MAG: hypothetical protein FJ265_00725 [Planctomycetes bacterium]|nr:hypothetical protein [Planctomycetota bacterium]